MQITPPFSLGISPQSVTPPRLSHDLEQTSSSFTSSTCTQVHFTQGLLYVHLYTTLKKPWGKLGLTPVSKAIGFDFFTGSISRTFTRAFQVYWPRTLRLTAPAVLNRQRQTPLVPSSGINSPIRLLSTLYGPHTSVQYVTKATFQHQHQHRLKCATSKWNTSRMQPTFLDNSGTTSTKIPNNNNNTPPNITPLPLVDTESIDKENKTNLKHFLSRRDRKTHHDQPHRMARGI